MSSVLPLTNVISVSILGAPSNLSLPNINTAALFSQETPSWSDAFKIYTQASVVATDFGSNSKAAAIATNFFAQQPNPISTNGYLVIILRQGAETTQAAILRTLNSVFYFGVLIDEEMQAAPTAFASLAAYVQTLDKMFFYTSSTAANYAPGGLLDLLRSSSQTHSRGLYYAQQGASPDAPWLFSAAYAGRALSTNFSGSDTTQTMHLKVLANVTYDTTLDQTALNAVQTAGVDVYPNIAGVPSLFTSGANAFFDEIYNEFWFKFALQTAGFNYLRATSTKIPQTESGIEGLKNEYRKVCDQAVNNRFVGPGSWTSPDVFGDPASLIRNVAGIGYYVYSQPISQQSTADRNARKAPLIQIAVKTQGAVHSSNVIVEVNL